MTKTILAIAIACATSSAFAQDQVASSTALNYGSISNTVNSAAYVGSGGGSSHSASTGYAVSGSEGYTSTTIVNTGNHLSGQISWSGGSHTSTGGTAYNVSSGDAGGSANSTGHASSGSHVDASYSGPGQYVNGSANSTTGGSSVDGVWASANEGGVFGTDAKAEYIGGGIVGSVLTDDGTTVTKYVYGEVSDSKSTSANAWTGNMIVNGTPLNSAPKNASTGSEVNVAADFADPL